MSMIDEQLRQAEIKIESYETNLRRAQDIVAIHGHTYARDCYIKEEQEKVFAAIREYELLKSKAQIGEHVYAMQAQSQVNGLFLLAGDLEKTLLTIIGQTDAHTDLHKRAHEAYVILLDSVLDKQEALERAVEKIGEDHDQ